MKLATDQGLSKTNTQAQTTMANHLFGISSAVASFEETISQAIRLKS
jgi:hypothetical protein